MKQILPVLTLAFILSMPFQLAAAVPVKQDDTLLFYGNSMVERLCEQGELEAYFQLANPTLKLKVRSLAWTGDEVGHRLRPEGYAEHLKYLLKEWPANVVIVGFGMNEAFGGEAGLSEFRSQYKAFLEQITRLHCGAKVVLLSPTAVEAGVPGGHPDPQARNRDIELYSHAIRELASQHQATFVDLYHPSLAAYERESQPLTTNGLHLNDAGNRIIARAIASALLGEDALRNVKDLQLREVANAAARKHEYVAQCVRPKNAIVYYGQRRRPDEYKAEIPRYLALVKQTEAQMHALLGDASARLADLAYPLLPALPPGRSNKDRHGAGTIKPPAEAMAEFQMAPGYSVNLFASEQEFPDLKNPVQFTFDARGRLWVVTMPSWPHTVPGEKPDDKILILEDTNRDGKADKCTIFARGFDALDGVAFHELGVIISAQPRLLLARDTNGDDQADIFSELLRGIDVTDSHHGGMVSTDPTGDVIFCDGVFHRSQLETPYGVHRGVDSTTYRLQPFTGRIETEYQTLTPNPWKVTYDRQGQIFQMYGGGNLLDPLPFTWTPLGVYHPYAYATVLDYGKGSAATVIDGPNFPADYRGGWASGVLLGSYFVSLSKPRDNAGILQATDRLDLIKSPNPAFRPVDLGFGFDGAMYITDFCNVIIGHAQHPMRDPQWDHDHGRIWRIVKNEGPVVKDWPRIEGASVPELTKLLRSDMIIVRHHARIALRAADSKAVIAEMDRLLDSLSANDADADQARLEALWVLHGKGQTRLDSLKKLLSSPDPLYRVAAVQLIRKQVALLPEAEALLREAATDKAPRVQLAVVNAVSHARALGYSLDHALHGLEPRSKPVTQMLKDLELGMTPRITRSVPVVEINPKARLTKWLFSNNGKEPFEAYDPAAKPDPKAKSPGNGVYRTVLQASKAASAVLAVSHGYLDVEVNGVQLLSQDSMWSRDQQVSLELKPGLNLIELTLRNAKSLPAVYLYDPVGSMIEGTQQPADVNVLAQWDKQWARANDAAGTLRIQAVPNQMVFSPKQLKIKAGATVKLVFDNPDLMLHNLLVLSPGSVEEVGALADKLATSPDGFAKQFIPQSGKILYHTPLLQPGQKATLEIKLEKPGTYPFVCTFPGHWRTMRGEIIAE